LATNSSWMAFFVDLHLGAADAQGTPGVDVSPARVSIGGLDGLNAERGNGVQVDQGPRGTAGLARPRRGVAWHPAAPALTTTLIAFECGDQVVGAGRCERAHGSTKSPDRANPRARWPRSRLRDPTATLAPSRHNSRAARPPTGPVAASTAAGTPSTSRPCSRAPPARLPPRWYWPRWHQKGRHLERPEERSS